MVFSDTEGHIVLAGNVAFGIAWHLVIVVEVVIVMQCWLKWKPWLTAPLEMLALEQSNGVVEPHTRALPVLGRQSSLRPESTLTNSEVVSPHSLCGGVLSSSLV